MDYRDNRQRWAESHQVVHFYAGQWCTFTPALTPMPFWPRSRFWARSWSTAIPPYLHATRRSARRYRFDYEEVDHVALMDLLKDLPCQVMVSGHPSALYDEMLAGWRSLALQVTTQAQVRTEVVWFNFAPDRVHWASYAGRNFTDRQRIKRKAANWGRRYKALPAGERLAVLAAMMAVDAEDP